MTRDSAVKTWLLSLASLVLGCGVLGCGALGNDECRTSADCRGEDECYLPDPPGVCGIPCSAERQCEAGGCEAGMACVETVGNCCFAGELASRCLPSCAAGGCPLGEQCNAEGACEVIACTDGPACPAHHTCIAGAVTQRADGCVRDTCASDGDCGGGYCVEGTCWEVLGQCGEVLIVP